MFKRNLVSQLIEDRKFHHGSLDLESFEYQESPFRSSLIPRLLHHVLVVKGSKMNFLIMDQLKEERRVPLTLIAFVTTIVCLYFHVSYMI